MRLPDVCSVVVHQTRFVVDITCSATTSAWVRRELSPSTFHRSLTSSRSTDEFANTRRRRRRAAVVRRSVCQVACLARTTSVFSASSRLTFHSATHRSTSSHTTDTAAVARSSAPTSALLLHMNPANNRFQSTRPQTDLPTADPNPGRWQRVELGTS